MKTVDLNDFFTQLYNSRPGQFIGLVTETVPDMRKTGNPFFGRVTKKSFTTVQIGASYTNAVNNRREKEGSVDIEPFIPKERKWGVRINGTPLVVHVKKGESGPTFYMECRVLSTYHEPEYYLDGRFVDMIPLRDEILSFITPKGSNAEWQGVTQEIIIRDYALNSIREVKMDKEVYVIER
jgi:hypothetical protein